MEADCSGGQSSPWPEAPRGRKEVVMDGGCGHYRLLSQSVPWSPQDCDTAADREFRSSWFPLPFQNISNWNVGSVIFRHYRGTIVGIATSYGLDDRGVGVRIPVGSGIFYSPPLLWSDWIYNVRSRPIWYTREKLEMHSRFNSEKPEVKRPLRRRCLKWKGNIKMCLKWNRVRGCGLHSCGLVREQWRSLLIMGNNIRVL
jgi:hypothetical protein